MAVKPFDIAVQSLFYALGSKKLFKIRIEKML